MRGVGSLLIALVTQVLLPVTVLLRRADATAVIWAALVARASDIGHRAIAAPGSGSHSKQHWSARSQRDSESRMATS